ncbi:MAG: alpha/beta fold hydrolase [Polaribacter sp.]|jgi:predicted alpha/beta-fold hydrolase|nr:alpha/beta fold hydrolase [Polaribacter sp.]MDC1374631.1 alpha/beta fold hydrolase [Polaribacter sp.]MDG1321670.1 alpha/beta fold hydrolase [Polaribacter sp.]
MPLLKSTFFPTLPFRNSHFNTIYRALFMKESVEYSRKRVTTWDQDFIDLDFSLVGSKTLVILIHGLEGSSQSKYILAATSEFNNEAMDTVAFNLRGCSGEDNLLLQTYHSGKTDDVHFIINYILKNYSYQNIVLAGYSLGGNLTLKYMGEFAKTLSSKIKCAIAVSVPVDLASSSVAMSSYKNKIYMEAFLKTLRLKVLEKAHKFPEFKLDKDKLFKAKAFSDFDALYTAPVYGYSGAEDYWEKASSKPYLKSIETPTLLISSEDDPFLAAACFPIKEAKASKNFYLEMTKYGGHVGFISSFLIDKNRWLENRMLNFIKQHL